MSGQTKTVKTSVYFDNDKFDLRADARHTVDSILDIIQPDEIFSITVAGNTDNSADSLYNIKLSDNRTRSVKNYLITKGFKENIIADRYFGEDKPVGSNETDQGKQKNRRVDLIFAFRKKVIPEHTVTDTISKKIFASELSQGRDTTIILPQGTQLVFNRNEYLEIKDCLEFTELYNPQDILVNGLTLMDTSGFPLTSCGMLRTTLKPGCSERECFKTPVKVRFPVPKEKECDYCGINASLYLITSNGSWTLPQGRKSETKIVKVHGKMFYQFELPCPNNFANCDCKPKGKKVKFKTSPAYRIVSVKVTYNCPTAVIELKPKGRKNIVKEKFLCRKSIKTVMASIIDDKGDTLVLKQQPLNDLPKRTIFSKCKSTEDEKTGQWLGVFPLRKREVYRKYIIEPALLTKQSKISSRK